MSFKGRPGLEDSLLYMFLRCGPGLALMALFLKWHATTDPTVFWYMLLARTTTGPVDVLCMWVLAHAWTTSSKWHLGQNWPRPILLNGMCIYLSARLVFDVML